MHDGALLVQRGTAIWKAAVGLSESPPEEFPHPEPSLIPHEVNGPTGHVDLARQEDLASDDEEPAPKPLSKKRRLLPVDDAAEDWNTAAAISNAATNKRAQDARALFMDKDRESSLESIRSAVRQAWKATSDDVPSKIEQRLRSEELKKLVVSTTKRFNNRNT